MSQESSQKQTWLFDVPRRLPVCVRKRRGALQAFDAGKIESALERAGRAAGEYGTGAARELADLMLGRLAAQHEVRVVTAAELQARLEETLAGAGYLGALRAAIACRERRQSLEDRGTTLVDAIASVEEYVGKTDWRVQANANQGFSLGGMILSVAGKVTANYWLSRIYPPEVGQAHREGDFHIHDLDMLSGYCAGWSLRMLLAEGFNGVPNKVESRPPKRLRTALGQMVKMPAQVHDSL